MCKVICKTNFHQSKLSFIISSSTMRIKLSASAIDQPNPTKPAEQWGVRMAMGSNSVSEWKCECFLEVRGNQWPTTYGAEILFERLVGIETINGTIILLEIFCSRNLQPRQISIFSAKIAEKTYKTP